MHVNSLIRATAIAVLGSTTIVACAKSGDKGAGDSAATTAAAPTDSAAAGSAAGNVDATPSAAGAQLTDANIMALLDEANANDSAGGSIALSKGTNGDVKDYGKMMMRDHHALRAQGQELAKKLNVTPGAPSNDTLPSHGQKAAEKLNSTAKGAEFDKAYIDDEVATHQAVIAMAQSAQTQAQNPELKALLEKAMPNLKAHLEKAQSIQKKLGTAQ